MPLPVLPLAPLPVLLRPMPQRLLRRLRSRKRSR
jgi:hypothetical protein